MLVLLHLESSSACHSNGLRRLVRCLLEAGADKDKTGENGVTPLFLASRHRHEGVVRCLLEARADANRATRASAFLDLSLPPRGT